MANMETRSMLDVQISRFGDQITYFYTSLGRHILNIKRCDNYRNADAIEIEYPNGGTARAALKQFVRNGVTSI